MSGVENTPADFRFDAWLYAVSVRSPFAHGDNPLVSLQVKRLRARAWSVC